MRFAFWIIKATHTLSLSLSISLSLSPYVSPPLSLSLSLTEHLIQIAFRLHQWLPELTSILLYTYIARLVQFHFAHLNGTDPTRFKNVMTYTNLYTW